jgi:DUF1680 family protein
MRRTLKGIHFFRASAESSTGNSMHEDSTEHASDAIQQQHSSLTRRELIQAAAWVTGGGLLTGSALEPRALLGETPANAATYRTKDRIAATPTFSYRPYRSRRANAADTVSWLQIDLVEPQSIDEIRLFPANQRMVPGKDEYYAGEGFPESFKVEVANSEDFDRPETIIDFSQTTFENPKDTVVSFPGKQKKARYVRLTVTKLARPACTGEEEGAPERQVGCSAESPYCFALSRIAVVSHAKDVAIGKMVSCDGTYGNLDDAKQLTRPERIEGEYVRRDRPGQVTDPAGWKRVHDLAHAPVSGVSLHGGLFETAVRNNIGYLLESFSVDDLLSQFRERAGKPVPASPHKPDKFWESDLAGSNAGRFLMGAGNTLRWIDDPELRSRFNAVMDGIAECRQPNGYVMAYPEDTIFYSERGAYTRAWLTHGLIEAGLAGNRKAFELLRGNYDWFNQCPYLSELLRGAVQGGQGMIANTRMYFTPVGMPADIQVIQRYFLEDRWLEELARYNQDQIWQYPYDRPHCYLLTNLEAYMDVYRATGDQRWHDGVKAGWEMYKAYWVQPGGSISIIEYNYNPPDARSLTQKLGELCGNSFWTFLSQRFQLIHPDEERYAAEIEASIYNVAIANQQGTTGLRYHTILVGKKEQGTRINSCCEGQGTRLIGSIPEHIYSVAADGIYVNLFEPSSIAWEHEGKPVSIRMDTRFPNQCDVKLTVSSPAPRGMKLRIRVPRWAMSDMTVAVNDRAAGAGKPGSYLALDRTWSEGDVVSFTLPAGFVVAEYTGQDQIPGHKRYSLMWGPLLYAAAGDKDAVLRLPAHARPQELAQHLVAKADAPSHYTVAGNPGVTYMPYWEIAEEPFTCFPVVDMAGA